MQPVRPATGQPYTPPDGPGALQLVDELGTVTAATGWTATYLGDGEWEFTVATGTAAGTDPEDGVVVTVPLRDLFGALVGSWTDRVVAGAVSLQVTTPPNDGDDIVAYCGIMGAADWNAGAALAAVYYESTRVISPWRFDGANWTDSPSPSNASGHAFDMTWCVYGGTSAGCATISCSEATGGDERLTGTAGIFSANSFLAIGAFCLASPAGDLTIRAKVTARIAAPFG